MEKQIQTEKVWGIFYETPNGELWCGRTHLGCVQLDTETVNLYNKEEKLQEIYQQTIAYTKRDKQAPMDVPGHARWEGWLKPEYRNGRVFISRLGSKDFPVEITGTFRFQEEGWALRVPCVIKKK